MFQVLSQWGRSEKPAGDERRAGLFSPRPRSRPARFSDRAVPLTESLEQVTNELSNIFKVTMEFGLMRDCTLYMYDVIVIFAAQTLVSCVQLKQSKEIFRRNVT